MNAPHAPHVNTADHATKSSMQAKTTKKIVLRMQCTDCKQTCMKPIKVRVAKHSSVVLASRTGWPRTIAGLRRAFLAAQMTKGASY